MADDSNLRTSRSARFSTPDSAAGSEDRPAGDPLAELARLIGQDDLFDQMRKDAARAELRAAAQQPASHDPGPPPAWRGRETAEDELRGTFDAAAEEPAPAPSYRAERTYPHGDPLGQSGTYRRAAAAPQADPEPDLPPIQGEDERYADAQGLYHADYDQHGEHTQPYYHDQHAAEPETAEAGYEDEAYAAPVPERRSRALPIIAAVVGLAAVGTVGAFGYRALTGAGDAGQPPVIKADGTPAKIPAARPEGQANSAAPDKPAGERVVSREEQPLEMKEARPPGPKMVTTTTVPAPPGSAGPQTPVATSATPPAIPSVTEPKKVRTFAVRPDGSTATQPLSTGPRSAVPVPTRVASASEAAAPIRTASIGNVATTGSTGTAVPAAASLPPGSYVVQLVSNKSEAEAQSAFKALQTKYPNVLGARQALIRRVELGGRGTYYRAQVGPFASNEQANEFCGNLKAAGGTCIVQRN